jgi:hypothetical protein
MSTVSFFIAERVNRAGPYEDAAVHIDNTRSLKWEAEREVADRSHAGKAL